jgi:hypothetical protein
MLFDIVLSAVPAGAPSPARYTRAIRTAQTEPRVALRSLGRQSRH